MYGESAEETILNLLGRSYTELVEQFGTQEKPVPAPIVHASLVLVEHYYTQRAPTTMQQLYNVPYGIDSMVKPYMRLAEKIGKEGCL